MAINYPGTDSPVGCGANSSYTVTYSVVSTDPTGPKVTVPSVAGLPWELAVQDLTKAGLTVVSSEQIDVAVPEPEVVLQSPPGGATVFAGSQVELVVGIPPGGKHPVV